MMKKYMNRVISVLLIAIVLTICSGSIYNRVVAVEFNTLPEIGACETYVSNYPSPTPYIVNVSYSGTMQVGKTVTLNVVLSETANRAQVRQYTVTVYALRDGFVFNLCDPKTITMSPGASSISISFSIDLSIAENLTTYVQVSSPSSGSILTEKELSTVSVDLGKWTIVVVLPSNRDYKGWLVLYDAWGEVVHECECLGRSVTDADTDVEFGNTPTGECVAELMGPKTTASGIASFGPYKYVKLDPVSGDMFDYTHRSLFRIHGGDAESDTGVTWYPLAPTEGCIRVSNENIYSIQLYISEMIESRYHDDQGYASIREVNSSSHITSVD